MTLSNSISRVRRSISAFVGISCVLPLYSMAQTGETIKIEAETATLSGIASLYSDVAASGGEGVAFLSAAGASMTLSNVPNSNSISITYASELQGEISLSVNDVDAGKVLFASTGAWTGSYSTVEIAADIPDNSELKIFFGDGDTPMNVDFLSFSTVVNDNLSDCPSSIGNLSVFALPRFAESEKDVCQIGGVLETDATLTADIDWYLEGGLQVGRSGYYPTLTINAGTDIFGDALGETDYVYVYAGASIQANGTSALPVRFLSDDSNFDGAGEWGGLYIAGDGDMQGDNLLDYVVVAEGGAEYTIGGTAYRDNIVIQGADDGTRLTFVQSHDSARDGIWIRDSSARLSWILVTGATRDGIWYRNFNGLVKDLMVLHRPETGRSGIYASATELAPGISNPRFVNVTLFDMDTTIESAVNDPSKREFGILFADYVIEGEFANVSIGNWKHGCYEVEPTADLTNLSIDGVHCTHNYGNTDIGVVREGGVDFPLVGIGNGDGIRYYDGTQNRLLFTGEFAERKFTAGWYVNKVGDLTNGLAADSDALSGFNDGDTNGDGIVDSTDVGATPLFGYSGAPLINPIGEDIQGFNDDVAGDTNGYDLTHNGAVRSGSDASAFQWNSWTVSTGPQQGFCAADLPDPTQTPPPADEYYIVHKPTGFKFHTCDIDDGTAVAAVSGDDSSNCAKWIRETNGDFFFLRHVESNKRIRPASRVNGAAIELRPSSWKGNFVQWSFSDTGDGFGHLVNRATGKHVFLPLSGENQSLQQRPSSWRGDFTRWMFEATN